MILERTTILDTCQGSWLKLTHWYWNTWQSRIQFDVFSASLLEIPIQCPSTWLKIKSSICVNLSETRSSTKKWIACIQSLTKVDQRCTNFWQVSYISTRMCIQMLEVTKEFIFLSDTLGLSLLAHLTDHPLPPAYNGRHCSWSFLYAYCWDYATCLQDLSCTWRCTMSYCLVFQGYRGKTHSRSEEWYLARRIRW